MASMRAHRVGSTAPATAPPAVGPEGAPAAEASTSIPAFPSFLNSKRRKYLLHNFLPNSEHTQSSERTNAQPYFFVVFLVLFFLFLCKKKKKKKKNQKKDAALHLPLEQ